MCIIGLKYQLMATLKLKHLILYVICFGLLIFSEIPGGALLALFSWMQLAILLWQKEFTLKNQIKYTVLFLSLVPTYFLWGAVNSFISIYAKESHFVFIIMYSLLSFGVCFWLTLFSVFVYAYSKSDDTVFELYSNCIAEIKKQKIIFLYTTLIVFLISISTLPLTEDYRIVLGIIAAHVFLKFSDLKKLI